MASLVRALRPMGDSLVLISLAILAGAPLALTPWVTVLAAMAIGAGAWRRLGSGVVLLAAAGLALSGLRAHAALSQAEEVCREAVATLSPPARCEGEAQVITSPIVVGRPLPTASQLAHSAPSQARFDVEVTNAHCGQRAVPRPFRARLYGGPEGLVRGDQLAFVADLAPLHLFVNPGLPDPRPPIARSGVAVSGGVVDLQILRRAVWYSSPSAAIDHLRAHVRRRIERTYEPTAAALARALVLGETDLTVEDAAAFRDSGLAHLLAVSGTHLVVAVASFWTALSALLLRIPWISTRTDVRRISALVTIPAAFAYADFAGGSGSALRAAAMLTATLLATAFGQRAACGRTLACSAASLALLDPLAVCDVSFALSLGATAGLMLLKAPILRTLGGEGPRPPPIRAAVAITLGAMLGCLPVLALLTANIPLASILTNLIAAPLGELAALPICLAHVALGWAPALERGAAWLGSGALLGVSGIAQWSTAYGVSLPVPAPTNTQLGIVAVTVALGFGASKASGWRAVIAVGTAALVFAEVHNRWDGHPTGVLRVTVLDVGQGDCLLVDLPDGKAMLIDGGGMVGSPIDLGVRVLLPVLRTRRRSWLDVIVISHPHPDHFGGLVSALPRLGAGELWITGQEGEGAGAAGLAYRELVGSVRHRGIPVRTPADLCGGARNLGGAQVSVLAPCPSHDPDGSANDNSLVLRIAYGVRVALLVGDSERGRERQLLEHPTALRADFLKVGHHGSRTSSSPAFVAAVRPSMAAISSGVRNRFGHPAPQTLATFGNLGIPTARTDRGGAILWTTDGTRSWITQGSSP